MKKTLNYSAYVLLIALTGLWAIAQETPADRATIPFSNPSKPGVVKASVHNGGIIVKGYNGKEVIVEARARGKMISEKKRKSEKATGMRLIQASSTGLTIEEHNNVIEVGVQSYKRAVDITIQVPYSTSLDLSGHNNGNIIVEKVSGEIEVNHHNGALTFNNVSGTLVAHTYNGYVKVTFDRIDPGKPMSFSSWNGDIDVTFPSDFKARVKMKSSRGDIYSDFDIKIEQPPQKSIEEARKKGGKYKISFGEFIFGSINGGGPEFQFNTWNGDIFIREGK